MAITPLLSVQEISKTYGISTLFEGISLSIGQGERIALIGPNGSGKSTLLRILAGIEDSDSGTIHARRELRCAYVAQEDNFDESLTVSEALSHELISIGHSEHETLGLVTRILGRAGFEDPKVKIATLSGGWKKRLSILRGLVVEPELLLLDEPTNHLDISGVLWLEGTLAKSSCGVVFVSHDRYFIERLAQKVVEINRKYPLGYFAGQGGYSEFIQARSAHLSGLQRTQESLSNKVRREVEWLRQGAKARTTKSKHRSDRAHEMIMELSEIKLEEKRPELEFSATNRKSRELIKVENVSKSIAGRVLFEDISMTLAPGVRLGIVGPNGSGKTTFVRTVLGELKPDHGRVRLASNLRISFFDQARKGLDRDVTLKQALCPHGGDSVVFNDKELHVASWAKKFLFSHDQLSLSVSDLSGGEQARVLLAKLMLEQSDVILFDEPTNDLDITTLEVLEESFCEFPGAVVLVSHDRYLLDRVSTTVLGLGAGKSMLYANYLQCESSLLGEGLDKGKNGTRSTATCDTLSSKKQSNKLGYLEQRELSGIETKIMKEEKALAILEKDLASEKITSDAAKLNECCQAIAKQQELINQLYDRWQELEEKKRNLKRSD